MSKSMKLYNKKVKLNADKILSDNKRTNKLFINFVNEQYKNITKSEIGLNYLPASANPHRSI